MKAKKLLKIAFLVLLFAVAVSVIGCSENPDTTTTLLCGNGHTVVIDEAVSATCTTTGLTEGKHCSVCNKIITAQELVPMKDHTIVIDKGVEATCSSTGLTEGSHCSVCNEVIIAQNEIPIRDHNILITKATSPTCTTKGFTEGSYCSLCFKTIKKRESIEPLGHDLLNYNCTRCDYTAFTDVSMYHSTKGYEYLGTLKKGDKMQELYKKLEQVCSKFHTNTSVTLDYKYSETNDQCLSGVEIPNSTLTYDDVCQVISLFKADCPVYYWLTANFDITYGYGHNIEGVWLRCDNDFYKGEDRKKANDIIYAAVKDYVAYAQNTESDYLTLLAYYDKIISSIDYAVLSDGVTANDSQWAHSVLGVFDKRGAVCEGYTKTLQLLLNFSGIENYYVKGEANGRHAWSLVKLEDGNWYWCDLTWDDDGDYSEYVFFCATDYPFLSSHTPFTHTEKDYYDRICPLPARPNTKFNSADVLEVYEDFVVNGRVYEVSGYKKARFLRVISENADTLPSTVSYNGIVYTVEN